MNFRRALVAITIVGMMSAMAPSAAFARHGTRGGGFRGGGHSGGGGGAGAAAFGVGLGLSLLGAAIAAQHAQQQRGVPARVHHRSIRRR